MYAKPEEWKKCKNQCNFYCAENVNNRNAYQKQFKNSIFAFPLTQSTSGQQIQQIEWTWRWENNNEHFSVYCSLNNCSIKFVKMYNMLNTTTKTLFVKAIVWRQHKWKEYAEIMDGDKEKSNIPRLNYLMQWNEKKKYLWNRIKSVRIAHMLTSNNFPCETIRML